MWINGCSCWMKKYCVCTYIYIYIIFIEDYTYTTGRLGNGMIDRWIVLLFLFPSLFFKIKHSELIKNILGIVQIDFSFHSIARNQYIVWYFPCWLDFWEFSNLRRIFHLFSIIFSVWAEKSDRNMQRNSHEILLNQK